MLEIIGFLLPPWGKEDFGCTGGFVNTKSILHQLERLVRRLRVHEISEATRFSGILWFIE